VKRDDLNNYLKEYLATDDFKDYCPNGLQVEGKPEINKIVTGVSASVELFERAIEQNADAIIVHHGMIWEFERPVYRGGYKKRVKTLLDADVSLFGYHLPLDAHAEVGNNVQIAQLFSLNSLEPFAEYKGKEIGFKGVCQPKHAMDIFDQIKSEINESALIFPFGPEKITSIGIVSGGAQKDVKAAVTEELDLYITGEVSEHILHYVKEEEIHFVAAGHHATERFGIKALGNHIADKFGLEVDYVDIPNPV
jgi:dinuclear metal center YbgI/SA1388 family protein